MFHRHWIHKTRCIGVNLWFVQLWGKISAVLSKSHDPWGLSCDFSPTSVGQPTSVYSQDCWGSGQSSGACLGGASPGARGSRSWQVGKEAAVATPPLSFTCWLTVVLSFSGGLGFFRLHSWFLCPTLYPFQAVSAQSTAVLSLGLSSEACIPTPSSHPYQQTCVLGWSIQDGGTDHLCKSLSCLPLTGCCAFLWASFSSQVTSLLVRGLPRVPELLFSFSSLPGVQDLFCFFSFSFCTNWLPGNLSCPFRCLRFSVSVQWDCSIYRCILDTFVGRGEFHILLLCHLNSGLTIGFLKISIQGRIRHCIWFTWL